MWIKICGVRDLSVAEEIANVGPDAIGLNFHPPSKRYVDPGLAKEIVAMLPDEIRPVGVFVNRTVSEIESICGQTGLKTVQLHGDETPEFAANLQGFDIIRAFRIGSGESLRSVAQELQAFADLGVRLIGCLVDAHVDGEYGGTGKTAPWKRLAQEWKSTTWPPLFLAGGLNPNNVAVAIQTVRPAGVDVASGVESAPGIQDPQRIRKFVESARQVSSAR
ncbi:MAG: phosphoribosylanthranilate isomerase [Planctomycetaceae bacterium]|nr:phosphoribosylanthranilate isomerase [Planctomycetaceae bacterium]